MFAPRVERWRASAVKWSAWASDLFKSNLDASDVLALVSHESGGDPTIVSPTGYRGLGQVGRDALADYNNGVPDSLVVDYEWLVDAERGDEQIRVVAWHMARGRDVVSHWAMPDAKSNAARWADVRYAWGGGNLRKSRARFVAAVGHEPTFDQLAAFEPNAGVPNVRPWYHANAIVAAANKDRGYLAEHPIAPLAPDSKKKVIAEIALGALALLGVVLTLVGIARIVSK